MRIVTEPEAKAILARAGVPVPPGAAAGSPEEALEVARGIGYPVVLKAVSPDIVHKTDAGAVVLNIPNPDALAEAYHQLTARLRTEPAMRLTAVLVECMMPPGTELIVGARQDSQFGPVVVVGLGGIYVEVLRDVACRVAPLDRTDAREMWQELKGAPLLTGARGRPRLDTDALEDLLLAVSRLAVDRPQMVELDLNPVLLYTSEVVAVDARMILYESEGLP